MTYTYTVILRYDGIDRTYPCENRWDYIVLLDALRVRYGHQVVEGWNDGVRLD